MNPLENKSSITWCMKVVHATLNSDIQLDRHMLREIIVSNFAVIENLHLSLAPGLTVVTGETGAGKSLLVDALTALLGGRVGAEIIRSGSPNAKIEGVFQSPSEGDPLTTLLHENGLETDEEVLIISREVRDQGRTSARINGHPVTLGVLRQIGESLVDIHGQSDHLSLLNSRRHLEFLDAYGSLTFEQEQVGSEVTKLLEFRKDLEDLKKDELEASKHLELLRFQSEEIDAAHLQVGEEEHLMRERELLANSQRLRDWCLASYQALSSSDGPSAVDLLEEAKISLKMASQVDPELLAHFESMEEAATVLTEAGRALLSYADSIELDTARQTEVEERLDLIARLRRKYDSTLEDLLVYGHQVKETVDQSESQEEKRAELERIIDALESDIGKLAKQLSEKRSKTLKKLEGGVEQQLKELDMGKVNFTIHQIQEQVHDGLPFPDGRRYAFNVTGVDRIEFLLSTNPGEEPRPLVQVASGGETSRLMLAIKSALQDANGIPILIFDELEMGVGARSGDVIGKKLWSLSKERQVLCVTHLPQVASYGDTHLRVAKEVVLERTFTQVNALNEEERVKELAEMFGGANTNLYHTAQDLLESAMSWKIAQV